MTSLRAILKVTIKGKSLSHINYSRRMYAILRRYTPDVVEGGWNECFAELTGLRTFLKMTYKEIAERIRYDVKSEIGISCDIEVGTAKAFDRAKHTSKKSKISKSISTYKEMNTLFAHPQVSVATKNKTNTPTKKLRLVVPFLGKVK